MVDRTDEPIVERMHGLADELDTGQVEATADRLAAGQRLADALEAWARFAGERPRGS